MRGEFVDVGGVRLYCYAFGSRGAGMPIVLVHGCFTSSHVWQDVLPLLPKGHRVLVLDLLGHGRSDRPAGRAMTADAHAERLLALLNELAVSSACIVGHGLGAVVALQIAHSCPARVSRLGIVNPVLMSADGRDFRVPGSLRRLGWALPIWKHLPGDWLASALHTALLRGYAQRDVGAHSLDLYLKPFRTREGRDAACDQLRALRSFSGTTASALAQNALKPPVAVVMGANDPFLTSARADRLCEALRRATGDRTRVHRLPGVAHVAPEEAPDRLATVIGELVSAQEM